MKPDMPKVAIVYASARVRQSEEEKQSRLTELKEAGFNIDHLEPQHTSENGYTAGTFIERAAILSLALTQRKYPILWAARGGFGATETIEALEHMLPPAISDKTFVGFSDASFLGLYLATRFPNFTYVHGNHAFDRQLFKGSEFDRAHLFSILRAEIPPPMTLPIQWCGAWASPATKLTGPCIPLNLSLAESLATLRHFSLPAGNILFLEDLNEDAYRLLRKIDSLYLSGFLANTKAIVLGTFTPCLDAQGQPISETELAILIAKKTRLPVFTLPIFGHNEARFPLVCMSQVTLQSDLKLGHTRHTIELTFARQSTGDVASRFPSDLFLQPIQKLGRPVNLHCTGIGGTGMAAVAGLFKSAGFSVTGSDNPIYPPMDKVIADLGIIPLVGFDGKHLDDVKPDAVILANVVSRQNAELKANPELERLLDLNIPIFSFPSALRKFFLARSLNIVVAGTHGKTTTTSIIAHAFHSVGLNPSFLIGGAPRNFESGFALRSPSLFILEGDEYDSAFFDKGPKFLHYEPQIALINNIEFDHADIYPNIEAIEEEFFRLARLTTERGGIVVANLSDARVLDVCRKAKAPVIGFADRQLDCEFPYWRLEAIRTESTGMHLTLTSPTGQPLAIETQIFGKHNALNVAASLAVFQAYRLLQEGPITPGGDQKLTNFLKTPHANDLTSWSEAMKTFLGVKRRFELIKLINDIAIFDDFAHHPTAINTTLEAFKSYVSASQRSGRLIACFDPRNATMRRSILQNELTQSFSHADLVFLGKVPIDLRLSKEDTLDGHAVAKACGAKARYFDNNETLCEHLAQILRAGDTVVFMSSGAFDSLPKKLAHRLESF